jgi:hypothetical protein
MAAVAMLARSPWAIIFSEDREAKTVASGPEVDFTKE